MSEKVKMFDRGRWRGELVRVVGMGKDQKGRDSVTLEFRAKNITGPNPAQMPMESFLQFWKRGAR